MNNDANIGDPVEISNDGKITFHGNVWDTLDNVFCVMGRRGSRFIFLEIPYENEYDIQYQNDAIFVFDTSPEMFEVIPQLTATQKQGLETAWEEENWDAIASIMDKTPEEEMSGRMGRRRRRKMGESTLLTVIRSLGKRDYAKAEGALKESIDRKIHKAIKEREVQVAEAVFGGKRLKRKTK